MSAFTESVVEDAALARLESLGYTIKHGPEITPGADTLTLTVSQKERESISGAWRDRLQKMQQLVWAKCNTQRFLEGQ